MKLDYGTLLSPVPITLSIGVLRKPTLREISELDDMASFMTFVAYEYFLKLTPEIYYTELNTNDEQYWDSLSLEEQSSISLYDIISTDKVLCDRFLEVLNFFFVETVIYKEGYFILLNDDLWKIPENKLKEHIKGIITKNTFQQVIELIQQICCIYEEDEDIDSLKFKNEFQKNYYLRMQKLKAEAKKRARKNKKKIDDDLTIPNIISSVSSTHSSINLINVWDLTVFQLLDTFNRLQKEKIFDINSTRVSVWGDEKKTFDFSLWYKNDYDKN